MLYFGGNRDTVYFDVLTSRGDLARYATRQWFASISAWMDGKEHLTGYTTRLDGASPWTFSANSPEVSESIERLGRLGELSTMGELCLISRTGGPYKGKEFANTSMGQDPRLEPDDIIMLETVGQRSNHAVRVGEATRSRERHLVLRPVDERVSVDFLVEYLNSPMARQLISATAVSRFGGAYKRISTEALRNLPVPIVDDASADSFDRVRRVEAQLRSKVEEMESLRISLFEARGTHDFKTRLNSLARVGEMMSASMEQVERQQFQIANFYPFPIAFGYRLLGSQVGPRATYEAQLRMAENMLAFVASVSLALVQERDREESGVNLRELWKGGVSAGGWKEAIRLCSKVFTSYKNYPLAAAINGLKVSSARNESFGGDVKELIKQRNDLHHGGGPATPEEFQKASEDLGTRLQRCMQRLNFFTEYPIREVQDLDVSRYSAEARLTCLRYVGDHPGLAQEELVFPRPLPKGDLFIDLGGENWVPLHPFVSVKVCPNCRTREIYFIDKWEDGRIKLKSFERGHTERDPGMVQDLEVWSHWEPQTRMSRVCLLTTLVNIRSSPAKLRCPVA